MGGRSPHTTKTDFHQVFKFYLTGVCWLTTIYLQAITDPLFLKVFLYNPSPISSWSHRLFCGVHGILGWSCNNEVMMFFSPTNRQLQWWSSRFTASQTWIDFGRLYTQHGRWKDHGIHPHAWPAVTNSRKNLPIFPTHALRCNLYEERDNT